MIKKLHIAFFVSVLIVGCFCGVKTKMANAQKGKITVVLDAGHGGIDVGVVASTGVKESDINLDMCYKIKAVLEKYCINVVLTRTGAGGLYGVATKGFKRRDMKKRKEIIENSKADLVVSLHVNKCPFEYRKGAQVFYKIADSNSKNLALKLQKSLNALPLSDPDNESLVGDYYLLNCSSITSVLIECGFFSNAQNEKQLLSDDYRKTMAGVISSCLVSYLLANGNP